MPMNLVVFRVRLLNLSRKEIVEFLVRLAVYSLLAATLWVLLRRYYPDPILVIFAIPIIAEFVLDKRFRTTISFIYGFLARLTGLVAAASIYYYLYVVLIVYEDQKPYPEEYGKTLFTVMAQGTVAAVILFTFKVIHRIKKKHLDHTTINK